MFTSAPTPPLYVLTYTDTTDVELSETVTTTPTNTISMTHTMRFCMMVLKMTTTRCRGVLSTVRYCATMFEITMLSA